MELLRHRAHSTSMSQHLAHILAHTGHAWTDTARTTHRTSSRATASRPASVSRPTHARHMQDAATPPGKKLDAQAHRRDCEAAAEAGRRRPAAGAPSPPRSMLTHPRFRPGSMHSAADSSVHLATLTLGRRGVRTRVAVVDAPARPRQVFFTEGCMSENGVLASHGHGSCLKRVVRQPCGSAVLPSWLFLSLAPRLVWTLQWPA